MEKNFNNLSSTPLQILWKGIDLVLDSWRLLIIFSIVSLILGFFYLKYTPAKYSATADIKSATIGMTSSITPVEVESAKDLISKLKFSNLLNQIDENNCQSNKVNIVNNLKIELINNKSMVRLSYSAKTPEIAKECILEIFRIISSEQNKIIINLTRQIHAELKYVEDKFILLDKKYNSLDKNLSNQNTEFINQFYLLGISEQSIELKRRIENLKTLLGPSYLNSTELVFPIKVVNMVGISQILSVLIRFIFLGILTCILFIFIRNYMQMIKS
jgi:hypothetical protein